jgi:hypothetical protein
MDGTSLERGSSTGNAVPRVKFDKAHCYGAACNAVVSSCFWCVPPTDIRDIQSGFLRVFYRDKLLSSYEASQSPVCDRICSVAAL